MGSLRRNLQRRRIIYLVRTFWFPFERYARNLEPLNKERFANDNDKFNRSLYGGSMPRHSKKFLKIMIERYFNNYDKQRR